MMTSFFNVSPRQNQNIDQEATLAMHVLYPPEVREQLLYILNPTGNIEAGLELDIWAGSYLDPVPMRWGFCRLNRHSCSKCQMFFTPSNCNQEERGMV